MPLPYVEPPMLRVDDAKLPTKILSRYNNLRDNIFEKSVVLITDSDIIDFITNKIKYKPISDVKVKSVNYKDGYISIVVEKKFNNA